jgi:glycosyltransferase involved in cell wall biosynthesis
MSLPLVSIGVPTFNRPSGLRNTLLCLTKQTYKNVEIIISDNYSNNSEVDSVIEYFKKLDNRIVSFKQLSNLGPVKNFEFVLNNALGSYFMWAADDDEWRDTFVEDLINLYQVNESCSIAISDFQCIKNGEVICHSYLSEFHAVSKATSAAELTELAIKHVIPAHLIYGMFRVEECRTAFKFMQHYNLWPYFASDQIFNLLFLLKNRMCYSSKSLYITYITNDAISFNSHKGYKSELNFYRGMLKALFFFKMNFLYKIQSIKVVVINIVKIYFSLFRTLVVRIMKGIGIHNGYLNLKKKHFS